MNRIFKMWPDKNFVHGEKNTGGKGSKGFRQNSILRAVLAALTTLALALRLVYMITPKSLVVDTFGIVRVLGGLWDGRV